MRQWFILSFLLVLLFCFGVIMEWGLVAEVGTKLFGILPELTPVLIGAGIVYIAWQQHKTNKNRLKMELFDKRYKVYESILAVVTGSLEHVDRQTLPAISRQWYSAVFLFENDKNIFDFMVKVSEAATALVDFSEANKFSLSDDPETILDSLSIKQRKEFPRLVVNIHALKDDALILFTEYLTLKA